MTPIALSIDCRSHTVQTLPSMPRPLSVTVADVINGKIYAIGNPDRDLNKVIMVVFNTETQMWEPEIIQLDVELGLTWPRDVVVMADKMYVRDRDNTFVYEPKENKWETDKMLHVNFDYSCVVDACVVDDVLYYHDCSKKKLRTYDPKKRSLGVVNGLEDLLYETIDSRWSKTVSYGGKLALFFPIVEVEGRTCQNWCAEISLERRQGRETWGKVERCDPVTIGGNFYLVKSLAVML